MNSELWGGPEDGRVFNIHAGAMEHAVPQTNLIVWIEGQPQKIPTAVYRWNQSTSRFEFRDWLYE